MPSGLSPLAWALPLALLAGCIPSRSGLGVMTATGARSPTTAAGPGGAGRPGRASRPATSPVLAAPAPTTTPGSAAHELPDETRPVSRGRAASQGEPGAARAKADRTAGELQATGALPAPAPNAVRATGYMRLTGDACEAELRQRGVPFEPASSAPGVDRPVRLTGPLHGVEIHEPGPRAAWHRSVNEILDCRLALALDDVAGLLAEQGFVEVIHVSFYRRGAHIARRKTPSQHAAGRAFDLSELVHRDGTRLDIQNDWGGAIGDRSCGPDATPPRRPSPAASALRSFVCEVASRGLVHLVLTPNFNADHRNHLHLDLEPRRESAEVK